MELQRDFGGVASVRNTTVVVFSAGKVIAFVRGELAHSAGIVVNLDVGVKYSDAFGALPLLKFCSRPMGAQHLLSVADGSCFPALFGLTSLFTGVASLKMNSQAGINFLRKELASLDAEFEQRRNEFQQQRKVITDAIDLLESKQNAPGKAASVTVDESIAARNGLTLKALVLEFANETKADFTKADVANYAANRYPGFLHKYSPRALSNILQKMAAKEVIERLREGENGNLSLFRARQTRRHSSA